MINNAINLERLSFLAYNSAADGNVTGNGTTYSIICDMEIFDNIPCYDNTTGICSCISAGRWLFGGCINLTNLAVTHNSIIVNLVTTLRTFRVFANIGTNLAVTEYSINFNQFCNMNLNDTARLQVVVSGGTQTVGVGGGASPLTCFHGTKMN